MILSLGISLYKVRITINYLAILKDRIKVYMITIDSKQPAFKVANYVGIEEINLTNETFPETKYCVGHSKIRKQFNFYGWWDKWNYIACLSIFRMFNKFSNKYSCWSWSHSFEEILIDGSYKFNFNFQKNFSYNKI